MIPFNSAYGFSVGSGSNVTVVIDGSGTAATSSYALTASYAVTASYALNGGGGDSATSYGDVYVISNGIFMP